MWKAKKNNNMVQEVDEAGSGGLWGYSWSRDQFVQAQLGNWWSSASLIRFIIQYKGRLKCGFRLCQGWIRGREDRSGADFVTLPSLITYALLLTMHFACHTRLVRVGGYLSFRCGLSIFFLRAGLYLYTWIIDQVLTSCIMHVYIANPDAWASPR